ncbi:hypothetical protein, partial [Marinobacter sp. EhC06]|uniref:hypothetical protein n=1 Tax=Marinobacter sp. EhC06 TaxID=1849169 RepID=UPI001D0D19A2
TLLRSEWIRKLGAGHGILGREFGAFPSIVPTSKGFQRGLGPFIHGHNLFIRNELKGLGWLAIALIGCRETLQGGPFYFARLS